MKRAFQIVGILLIILLGAGPASAAVGCVLGNSAMAACPMGTAGMDADCPMSHALAAVDCSQDCCNRTGPFAPVVNAVPVKPTFLAAVPSMAKLTVPATAEGDSRSEVLPVVATNSPPRYILLRVFRI